MTLKKERDVKLQWWVDFYQTDLAGLSKMDKSRLQLELSFYSTPSVAQMDLPPGYWYPDELLEKVQEIVRNFIEREFRHQEQVDTVTPIPRLNRQLVFSADQTRFEITYPRLFSPGKKPKKVIKPEKEWIESDLAELINGIPRGSLKKCKRCDKLFLHTGKKPKEFCSKGCNWKYFSKQWRDRKKAS